MVVSLLEAMTTSLSSSTGQSDVLGPAQGDGSGARVLSHVAPLRAGHPLEPASGCGAEDHILLGSTGFGVSSRAGGAFVALAKVRRSAGKALFLTRDCGGGVGCAVVPHPLGAVFVGVLAEALVPQDVS